MNFPHITPMTDAERVLDQIQRGEIRCGREAARAIAARHQAAYGDAVWGPSTTSKEASVTRPKKRRAVQHAEVAAELRTQPGEWTVVGEWPSTTSAESTALRIRTAYQAPMYEPAGAFEARTQRTEFGCEVVARYVGERQETSNDEAWTDAVAALSGGEV